MKRYWKRAGVLCLTLIAVGFFAPRFVKPSRAQSEATTYRTSGEAAKAFMVLLTNVSDILADERRIYYSGYDKLLLGDEENAILISSDNVKKLQRDGVWSFILRLAANLKNSSWEIKSESGEGDSAKVTLAPNPNAPRDVVCVKEPSGWKVDVLATYALWNQLNKDDVEKITTRALENSRRASCQSNMKQIALGFKQYIQDWDELHPPAKTWQTALYPYVKSAELFNCPSVPGGKQGYAMNWKLSKQSEAGIDNSASMIMLYESTTLKANHSGEGKDIAYRHFGGTNMGFVDGHVKWYKQGRNFNSEYVHFTFKPNYYSAE